MIKYELSTSCQQTGKNWPTREPHVPPRKISFINAIQPFYGCQRNARKILPLLCRLGLVLQLGSVYVELLAVTVWWR